MKLPRLLNLSLAKFTISETSQAKLYIFWKEKKQIGFEWIGSQIVSDE